MGGFMRGSIGMVKKGMREMARNRKPDKTWREWEKTFDFMKKVVREYEEKEDDGE